VASFTLPGDAEKNRIGQRQRITQRGFPWNSGSRLSGFPSDKTWEAAFGRRQSRQDRSKHEPGKAGGEIDDLHGILPLQDDLAAVQLRKNHRQNYARDGPGRRRPGVLALVHIENMTRAGAEC